jgi:hypothetical protein
MFIALHPFCAARTAKSGSRSARTAIRQTTEGSSSDSALELQRRQQQVFLKKRLRDEMRLLEEQETQREALVHASIAPPPPADSTAANPRQGGDGSATLALRQELETARQRLAELRVNDTDLHPDVIAAHEKVVALQQQLREADATSVASAPQLPKVRVDSQPGYESKLSQIDAVIKLQDKKIEDDKRQLAMLRGETRISAGIAKISPSRQLSEAVPKGVPADPILRRPSLPISKRARSATAIVAGLSLIILALAGVFLIPRKWRSRAIRDSATLQEMLPTEVDYIGSIPRMKAG